MRPRRTYGRIVDNSAGVAFACRHVRSLALTRLQGAGGSRTSTSVAQKLDPRLMIAEQTLESRGAAGLALLFTSQSDSDPRLSGSDTTVPATTEA